MFNQLSLFLAQNNILDNNQSGFRSGHSTETALLSVTEALRLARAASKWSLMSMKKAHVTPLFIRLHWLPIAARIKFKVLMFAYNHNWHCTNIPKLLASSNLRPPEACVLQVNAVLWCHPKGTKSLSRTFSWTVPSWWNDLPISILTAESLAIFKKHLKTHLFRQHLTN